MIHISLVWLDMQGKRTVLRFVVRPSVELLVLRVDVANELNMRTATEALSARNPWSLCMSKLITYFASTGFFKLCSSPDFVIIAASPLTTRMIYETAHP